MTGLVAAQVLDSLETMDEENLSKTVVKVARGYVVVEEQERSLFIDYRSTTLFILSKKTDICQQFDILNPTEGDRFVLGKIDLFGEFEFLEEGGFQGESDGRYSRMKVLYAPRAMMLRGVRSARFKQFGMTFDTGIVEYLVDRNHGNFNLFVEAAESNAAMGAFNPLLLQLDLTHMFSGFSGVPVRQKNKDAVTVLSFVIEEETVLRKRLPQQCSSL